MKDQNLHSELKQALKAFRQTLTEWAASLVKPDGSVGVSHTAVIRTAQGKEHIEWIRRAIIQKIRRAKQEYPKFYAKKSVR